MDLHPKNILIFALLLGGVAHVMIFQDGYWNNMMWLSAILTFAIPLAIYRYTKIKVKTKNGRQVKHYADI